MTHNLAAGLLMCRVTDRILEYFLVHPGGPYFKNKDSAVWTIPKGLPEEGETPFETSRREFIEETGITPQPPFYDLGTVKQKSGKVVHAWAFKGNWDPATGIHCNEVALEWPPRSGKMVNFPEVDKGAWMEYAAAKTAIIPAQLPFLDIAQNIFSASAPT